MAGIRVGIVGVGFGQQVLIPAFQLVPKFTVTAVAASSAHRAERVRERFGLRIAYGDWRALVDSNLVDVVAVAVPPVMQPMVIRAAIMAGKPIFCEKPVAVDVSDAVAACELADMSDLPNMVDFWLPELPVWQRVGDILLTGEIGPIRHITVQWNLETFNVLQQNDSWKRLPEQGGGVLNGFVSHVLHYLEWLFGPIDGIGCMLHRAPDLPGWVETLALINGRFVMGAPFSICASNHAVHGNGHRLEVHGRDGSLVLENSDNDHARGFTIRIGDRRSRIWRVAAASDDLSINSVDGRIMPVTALVCRFAEWIETGRSSVPSLKQGLRVQTLLDVARVSDAEKGTMCFTPNLVLSKN